MDVAKFMKEVRDPYERKARVFPGLLVVLPLLVPALWIFGPKNPLLSTLLTLVTSCGVLYGLSSIARGRGKALEEHLVAKWGGMPTTCVLRHRDEFLEPHTKLTHHAQILQKLNISMPTENDEARNPIGADQLYMAAARALRARTRGKTYSLLFKENIAYGFHRNMSAMRPIGIATSVMGLAVGTVLSKAVHLHPFDVDFGGVTTVGGVTFAFSCVMLAAWLYFTHSAVRRIGYVYAERLYESLSTLR